MRIRFLKTVAGPNGAFTAGQSADIDPAAAYSIIEGGGAEQIDDVERAVMPSVETTVLPQNKKQYWKKKARPAVNKEN